MFERLIPPSVKNNEDRMKCGDPPPKRPINEGQVKHDSVNPTPIVLKQEIRPPQSKRKSWDEYFMEYAQLASTRSVCLRRQVGAVVVKDRQILATGYNGPPRGASYCKTCIRQELGVPSGQRAEICRAVHAEQNCIIQAAYHGVAIAGSIIYINTGIPCNICAKMIVNAGIVEVICPLEEYDELGLKVLQEAGIKVRAPGIGD